MSCAVIRGRAHDSPVFREMIKNVLDGVGCVMLDAGYDAHENYKMIRSTGRRPVICTRKNHVVKEFGPMAEMLRWQEKNPEEFEDTCHRHSIVKSVFSSFKCRFTARLFAQRNWQRKDCSYSSGASVTTCCHNGTTQKTRVVCLAYAVQPCKILAQDAPHHILPRKNSVTYMKCTCSRRA